MRRWGYAEPTSESDQTPVFTTVTDNEILERCYPWWARKMMERGHVAGITPLNCIDDFVVVHWAERVR